jgi:hypothetical protein
LEASSILKGMVVFIGRLLGELWCVVVLGD